MTIKKIINRCKKMSGILLKIKFCTIIFLYVLSKIEAKIRSLYAKKYLGKEIYILNKYPFTTSKYDMGLSIDIILDKQHIRENSATIKLIEELEDISKKEGKLERLVDIGANIGFFSVILSKYFNQIVAIEPVDECIPTLKKNLSKINKKTKLYQFAVGTKDGFINMEINKKLNLSKITKDGHKRVKLVNINKVIKETDFVKIDVEGYEYQIIKHMKKFPRFLYMELHVDLLKNNEIKEIIDILSKANYKVLFAARKEESPYNRTLIFKEITKKYVYYSEGVKVGIIRELSQKKIDEIYKFINKKRDIHVLNLLLMRDKK